MPTEELVDVMSKLMRDLLIVEVHTDHLPPPTPAESTLAQHIKRRNAWRAKNGWTPEQIARGSRYIRTRPSDGRPVGDPEFDYEEYETRKRDRLAADPDRAAKRKARIDARRAKAAEPYVKVWLQRQVEAANADIASLGITNRMLDIWLAIIQSEQSKRLEDIHLDQRARIANRKNLELCQGRPRGLARAARKAGL